MRLQSLTPCAMLLQVLLRALRDFNLGKLTADDTGIFMGLLNDLFPKTLELVPRAVEKDFESKVCSRLYRCTCWLLSGHTAGCWLALLAVHR